MIPSLGAKVLKYVNGTYFGQFGGSGEHFAGTHASKKAGWMAFYPSLGSLGHLWQLWTNVDTRYKLGLFVVVW